MIVQTAHGGIDKVVSAMRAGAIDFVVKPVGAERLQVSLAQCAQRRARSKAKSPRMKRSRAGTLAFKDIITAQRRACSAVLRTAEKAAASNIPVLIEGESGVGKELIARAIHGTGERRAKPFVAVNCGAIPDNLVESILFGHEKGAFTGATERHVGKFVEATGGTLFLDEVGELPPAAQVKLLRAIQEGEVDPVGARKPVKVDVRIISATNRDLIADVKAGRFREDLFYRLHVFPITVPPLRERAEDIPDLMRHFLVRFAAEEGKRIRAVSADALALLTRLSAGPAMCASSRMRCSAPWCSPTATRSARPNSRRSPPTSCRTASAQPPFEALSVRAASLLDREHRPRSGAAGHVPRPTRCRLLDAHGNVRPLDELEAEMIRFAIAHYRGQMSEVARRLRIGRSTLYRKLESSWSRRRNGRKLTQSRGRRRHALEIWPQARNSGDWVAGGVALRDKLRQVT